MTTTLHDLRGMVRGSRKRHRRAHRECDRATVREWSPTRLVLTTPKAQIDKVHAALREVASREKQLRAAEFDRFTSNGFTTKERA